MNGCSNNLIKSLALFFFLFAHQVAMASSWELYWSNDFGKKGFGDCRQVDKRASAEKSPCHKVKGGLDCDNQAVGQTYHFRYFSSKNFCEKFKKAHILDEISGTAKNAKFGAVVLNITGPVFVEGLAKWSVEYLGKKVKVSGNLSVKQAPQATEPAIGASQGFSQSKIRIIRNAKWVFDPP